jgi:hypothetical protein
MKKGIAITLVFLMKLVLTALIIVGVIIPLGVKIYGLFKPDREPVKDMKAIRLEIEDLVQQMLDDSQVEAVITMPISTRQGYSIWLHSTGQNNQFFNTVCKKSESCLILRQGDRGVVAIAPITGIKFKSGVKKIRFEQNGVIVQPYENEDGQIQTLNTLVIKAVNVGDEILISISKK